MSRMSSKVQFAKCQGFGHIFVKLTTKPLDIQAYKVIGKKERLY